MKSAFLALFFASLIVPSFARAQAADNTELRQMFEQDQHSRMVPKIDWERLTTEDSLRRLRVYQLIDSGKVVTAQDYYHSALIFQHGMDTSDFAMAMHHMKKAIGMDSSINRWLLAAATDRYLMNIDSPQIYGTQYTKEYEKDARWVRYKIDSAKVTDEERRYYGVETLAGQRFKLYDMNLLSVSSFYDSTKSLDKTLRLIATERKMGNKARYSTSEDGLNTFGYELMNSGKEKDALQILRLNTEFHPKSSNAFDSYGECLLKLNQKAEAIKAYQRSLALNPRNDNAKKVLSSLL